MQIEYSEDEVMPQKGGGDHSSLPPMSGKESERSRVSELAVIKEHDVNVLRQNPKRNVISRYMKEKNALNDEKEEECTKHEASTNDIPVPSPKVHQVHWI
jgi:hypothetical protein